MQVRCMLISLPVAGHSCGTIPFTAAYSLVDVRVLNCGNLAIISVHSNQLRSTLSEGDQPWHACSTFRCHAEFPGTEMNQIIVQEGTPAGCCQCGSGNLGDLQFSCLLHIGCYADRCHSMHDVSFDGMLATDCEGSKSLRTPLQ